MPAAPGDGASAAEVEPAIPRSTRLTAGAPQPNFDYATRIRKANRVASSVEVAVSTPP
jgi:hypothetical protein